MNLNSSLGNPSFKGRRDDLNHIKSLTEDNMPILPNKRTLILSAVDNVAQTGDDRDIEMLMKTVETMKYGIRNNSEFARTLGGVNGEKENTDWDGILQKTIRTAIDSSTSENKPTLEAEYTRIFGAEKPLTDAERTMLQLREDILSSREMKKVLDDPDKTIDAARISQNLDYFVASSEISEADKLTCLGKMKYFLSDEFEIHPQLKDYKVQTLGEIINDMIIKRPDEDALTIKDSSQKQTGMCAAISIARKVLPYEDKVRFMDVVMGETDNKPTMSVYDRTKLGTGEMIDIPKAHVDFTDGMKKGYRIIDTATHQWMNAAGTTGDGTVSVEHYTAFDPENFEIFRDGKWLADMPEEYRPAQNWLRFLMKENGAVDNAAQRNASIKTAQREIGDFKSEYQLTSQKASAAIRGIISQLSPEVTDLQATTLTRQVLKADKTEDKQYKILDSDTKEVRCSKLAAFLKSQIPTASDEVIAANIEKADGLRTLANDADAKLAKLKANNDPKAVFSYNKNLFTAAAHHRRSVEAELEIPERLLAYEKSLNIPVRENLINETAEKLTGSLSSESVLNATAERFGVDAEVSVVKSALEDALRTSEVVIPQKLDTILAKLGAGDRVQTVKLFLTEAENKIKAGDAETLMSFAETAHVKPDAALVLKKIAGVKASMDNNPSNKQTAEAVALLGYNNQIEMTADVFKTFSAMAESGQIPADKAKELLGSDVSAALTQTGKEIKAAADKQSQIERQLGLPTRKETVLSVLEATGEVLPERTLIKMQDKFDKVAEVKADNDSRIVDPGAKRPKVPDSMYLFTREEKQIYAQLESKIPSMKKYAKVNYEALNESLAPQLDALYAKSGRLGGRLWVGGEGESGLYDNQSIRVLEMIMGKRYYNEPDIDVAVAHIKEGNGSGTSSTNVSHKSYSGHAQYVMEVAPVTVIDPETKVKVIKDALFHDNTWGRAEDSAVWTDEYGVERTDYGNGYGGPDGYIFRPNLTTGTFVDDVKTVAGILPTGEKFDLWKATRISGVDPEANKNLEKVVSSVLELGNAEETVAQFEQKLKSSPEVDMRRMDAIDSQMGEIADKLVSRVEKGAFKSQEKIDALPDTDILKIMLEKTAVQMSTDSKQIRDYLTEMTDPEAVKAFKEQLPIVQKELMSSPFAKSKNAVQQIAAVSQDKVIELLNQVFASGNAPENPQEFFNSLYAVEPEKLDGSLSSLRNAILSNAEQKVAAGIKDKKAAAELTAQVRDILSEAIDAEFTIDTPADIKKAGDCAKHIEKYVDKKFNVSSDEELVAAYRKLQEMTTEEFNAFTADMTPEDMGITTVSTLDVARQINAQKTVATELFKQNARVAVILSNAPEQTAPEWDYRGLKMALAPVENYTYVQRNGSEMYKKYGVRGAFPETVILSKEELQMQASDTLENLKVLVQNVKSVSSEAEKAQAVSDVNSFVRAYAKGNILPSHESRAIGLLNTYIKAAKVDPESKAALSAQKAAEEFISENHITTDVNVLLKTFVSAVQSGKVDEETLASLRGYLTDALNISDISSVEYSLIDNEGNGYAAMLREKLAATSITTADGANHSLDSDEGVLFIADKLANSANGSTALQVFFAQSALSEKAADVIASSLPLDSLPESFKQLEGELVKIFTDIKTLDGNFASFETDNTVSYASYKDALIHLLKSSDKKYADKSDAEKTIYSAYKKALLKTINADFAKSLKPDEIIPTLSQVHQAAVTSITEQSAAGALQLNQISEILEKRMSAMSALELPKGSEKEGVREKFIADADKVYAALEESINAINAAING